MTSPPVPGAVSRTSPFVGRSTAVAAILDHLRVRAPESGQPRVAIVGGDAGMGKTRLLTEVGLVAQEAGWRVLVPRGGPWGDSVAADLRAKGASPVVAAMINFAPTADAPALEAALARLAAGGFDWVTVTSATTVDVLSAARAVVPPTTRAWSFSIAVTTCSASLAGERIITEANRCRPMSCSSARCEPRAFSVMPVRWAPGKTVVSPIEVP